MYAPDEVRELELSYRMYVEGYDREIDDRPPLDEIAWREAYGEDVLREARERGDLRRQPEPGEYGYEEPHEDLLNELQGKFSQAIEHLQARADLLDRLRVESHLNVKRDELTEAELEEAWDRYFLDPDSGWGWEAEVDYSETGGEIAGLNWAADMLQILAHGGTPAQGAES